MPFTRQRHNGTKHLNDALVNDATVNDTLSNAVQIDETLEHDSLVNDVSAASSSSRFSGAHATLSSQCAARHMSTHAHDRNAHSLLHPLDAASMSSRKPPIVSRLALPVFAACAGAFSILQAFAKPSGVWGWTSGSQTYLRARPGAKTPAVAKVPRHTKMFVWGKFDGWYRVETPDHKFGWVFNSYIRSTDESKIPELSHRKARLASNRTENQTMYGSPALLRQHLARYGAKGAAQGLEKQGIRVAGRSTSRRATNRAISRTRLARNVSTRSTSRNAAIRSTAIRNSAPRNAASRNSPSRNTAWREIALASSRDRFARTAAPDFNDVGNVRLMPAQSPRAHRDDDRLPETTTTNADAASSRTSSQARATRTAAPRQQKPSPRKTQAKPQPRGTQQAAQAQQRAVQQRATQQKLVQQKLVQQKLVQQKLVQQKLVQQKLAQQRVAAQAAQQRVAQTQAAQKRREQQAEQARLAQARETEAARLAQVRKAEQQRLAQEKAARIQLAQERAAQQKLAQQKQAQERAVQQKLAQERLAQRRLAEQQAAQERLAERGRKAEAGRKLAQARRAARYAREAQIRSQRRALRQQRLAQQKMLKRDRLRARLGTAAVAPSMATPELRPLTPDELLRARNDYLAAKKKNQPSVASGTGITASDDAFNGDAAQAPAVSPSSYRAPGKGQTFSTVTRVSYNRRARSKRSGLNARNSRGGSPRDYMYRRTTTPAGDSGTATSGSLFGQTMARQAMSYRGMPYISGASSPNRGFDCSGLIYCLLRQRGYNPPRTAAGMAAYGKSVGRGELQSGDLVLFSNTYKRGISHIGIYVGNGKFVHAANHRKGVSVDSLSSKYYASKYYGARRVK